MGIEIGLAQVGLTSSATQDFTSTELSAAPKGVLALLGDCGANGTPDGDWRMGIGATDGTRENCAVAESTNGAGTVSVERLTRGLTCQRAVGTSVDDQLTHNAFLANGWRANVAEPGNFGKLALACLFGGSDTTIEAGRFTLSGTTPNTISFTNTSLNPNVIIFLSSGRLESTVSDNNFTPSIGMAVKDATITQRCWAMNHEHGITTSDPRQHVHTDRVIVQTVPSVYEITLDEINAGNMKLTAGADSGTDEYVYLAMRFDNANLWLGDVNLPTVSGVHAESGPGFQPKFVLQLSTMLTAFDVDASDATAGALALSLFNATEQFCYSWTEQDNVGTTNNQSLCNSKAMHFDAHDGTLAFDGAFSAFTSTGYEINYSTVDGTARKGFALAIGEAGTGVALSPSEANHAHTADAPALTQAGTLAVAGATHAQASAVPSLSQAHVLAVDEGMHEQTAEVVTFGTGTVLSVSEALHAQSAESVALTQAYVLVVQSAQHAQQAEEPTFSQSIILAPQAAAHAQQADAPVLSQAHLLAIQATLHAHSADVPALLTGAQLVISDALHAHLADNIIFPGAVFPAGRLLVVQATDRLLVVSPSERMLIVTH